MPFSFPASPSIGDKSTQNSREYEWSGYAWEIVATPAALSASVITSGTFDAARLPLATTIAAGAVIVGTGLGVSSGTVSVTYGTNSTSACRGDDSRLSDTRTPTDGSVTTAKLANDAVTYAKIQNVSATDRLLGRSSAGSGDVEEITCTAFARTILDDTNASAARATLAAAEVNHTHSASDVYVPDNYANFGGADLESVLETIDGALFGGAPTVSPAFTGAATFANTGNVVPLTITNTGTANSFVVNDASGDTSPFVVDASGNVACGASTAKARLHTSGASAASPSLGSVTGSFLVTNNDPNYGIQFGVESSGVGWIQQGRTDVTATAYNLQLQPAGGQVLVPAGSGTGPSSYVPGLAVSNDPDTGLQQVGGANTISLVTAGSERFRVASNGDAQVGGVNVVGLRYFDVRNTDSTLNSGAIIRLITRNAANTSDTSVDLLRYNSGLFAITNNDSGPVVINTGGSERVRVDADGNVGIGVSPAASTTSNVQASGDITLYGASRGFFGNLYFQSGFKYAGTGYGWGWVEAFGHVDFQRTSSSGTAGNTATLTTAIRITTDSEVLIGTTTDNGAYLLQVNSQIYATNATIATSDARFKTNVEALTDATAVIEALRPVAFDFIPHAERNFATERQVGLIAQEAQSALAGTDYADSVVAQCGDHLGLAYEKLVPVLIKALQESNARIAALEERLNHA